MHPSESRPPMFLRLRRLVPHLLVVAAVVALTRLVPLASLPPDGLLNTDELELTFAALDRFVGAPSNVLIWPAGPLQMLAVPIFAVDFLLSSHFHASPLAFDSEDSLDISELLQNQGIKAYRSGTLFELDEDGSLGPKVRTTYLRPTERPHWVARLNRSLASRCTLPVESPPRLIIC